MQGEDRDSSDEEWASAYARMDPISQWGWRNRRGGAEGPAEQIMRDVYEAADVVHSDAMSEMVGSTVAIEEERVVEEQATLPVLMPHGGDGPRTAAASVEVDQEGRTSVRWLRVLSYSACVHAGVDVFGSVHKCSMLQFNIQGGMQRRH